MHTRQHTASIFGTQKNEREKEREREGGRGEKREKRKETGAAFSDIRRAGGLVCTFTGLFFTRTTLSDGSARIAFSVSSNASIELHENVILAMPTFIIISTFSTFANTRQHKH